MRPTYIFIRISLLILILLSISDKSFSQRPDEEYQIGSSLLSKSDYKNALNHFSVFYSNYNSDTLNNHYYTLLYSIGLCYFQLNQYDSALFYYQRGYSINKLLQTEIDDNSLNKMATTYYKLGNYSNALKIYLEDLSIIKIKYGENSKNYAFATSNVANSYNKLKKNKEAEEYYLITLQKKELLFGKISNEYSSTLAWLTDLYISSKQFKKAENFCLELIEIRDKLSGNKNYYYQHNLFKLAKVYEGLGDLINAEIKFDELVSNIELKDSSFQLLYFQSLVSLTKIYLQNGDFPKAKTSLLKLQSKELAKSFPDIYLQYLNVSMVYYLETFDYVKAYNSNQEIINIHTNDTSNICLLASDFNANGEIFRRCDLKDKAKSWYLRAQKVMIKCGDTSSVTYASVLNNLALLYENTDTATFYLISGYNVLKKIKDNEPVYFSSSALNLAIDAYYHKKDTQLTIDLLDTLVIKYRKYLSPEKLERFFTLSTDVYLSLGLDSIAANSIRVYLMIKRKNIVDMCSLSSSQLNAFFENDYFEEEKSILPALNKLIKDDPTDVEKYKLTNHYFNLINLRNSLLLKTKVSAKDYFDKSDDENIKHTYAYLVSKKNILVELEKANDEQSLLQAEETRKDIDSVENILLLNSNFYSELYKILTINSNSIVSTLKQNEASILFFLNGKDYYSFILRPEFKEPKLIYLFEQNQLESIIKKEPKTSDSSYLNKLYQYGENGKKLQELIWKPIDSLLNGVKIIYAIPTGMLYTINLSALPLNNNIRTGDKYNLRIIGSNGELVSHKEQYLTDSSIKKAWIFGGIDYDNMSYTRPKFNSNNEFVYNLSVKQDTRTGTNKWNYLLNTFFEASIIDTLCRLNKISTSFVNGKLASKTFLKNISGENSPYILHLATHGYFFPYIKQQEEGLSRSEFYNKQNSIKMSDDPLIRSGLIFSGANKAWANPKYKVDSTDDGILTALEVANLDLKGAKLVVMSACETGLGDINTSEGIFGLQRAFKLAGAKNIIMSLWKVPDAQTRELMRLFYENCFNGLSVSDALRAAQTEMSKKYPPYYWAAFKLLE